ncbi:MAG TPA: cytochrome c [Gemmatimonadaceae bacterium]|nr:cytochrome c [Gemmatimonadaceae bacterium]
MSTRRSVRRPSFGDVAEPISWYRPLSFVVLALVLFAGLGILMIGARSPYTHSNLAVGFDPRYDRTSQILVGADAFFTGLGRDAEPASADPATRGAALFVTQGCASCHALGGGGGPVGPRIVGIDEETIAARVRQGPLGMPRFSPAGLTDAEIADIATYLRSLDPLP